MKTTSWSWVLLSFALACGESSTKLTINLTSGQSPLFDPYAPDNGLAKVRVRADGLGRFDDTTRDLGPAERSISIEGAFEEGGIDVRVEGYDAIGNLVAYGAADDVAAEGDQAVDIAFRRNVAVATHLPNAEQDRPEGLVYVIDLARRTYVGKVRLPGSAPVGRKVSARGGDGVFVTYDDGANGFAGYLSADTAEWRSIPLGRRQDIVLGRPGKALGVAAGGGTIAIVDLDAGRVLHEFNVGGTVLDAEMSSDGQRAVVVVDLNPGVVVVNLTESCTNGFAQQSCLVALDVVPDPGGVAIGDDGRTANVVSSLDGRVARVDLSTRQSSLYQGRYPVGVGAATFSSEIQSVLALQRLADGTGRVHTFVVANQQAVAEEAAVQTYLFPRSISTDPSGRRAIVVSTGTSPDDAGITVVETALDQANERLELPVGSSRLYPSDPDDTYQDGNFTAHHRYQPVHAAVLNGR